MGVNSISKKYRRTKKLDIPDEELNTIENLYSNIIPAILSGEQLALSQKIIEQNLTGLSFFYMGDVPNFKYPKLRDKYVGGFINADKSILTLGIFIKKRAPFSYAINDIAALAYVGPNDLYIVEAMFRGIKEIRETEIRPMMANIDLPKKYIENFEDLLKVNRFLLVDLCMLKSPEKHQRREYIRFDAKCDVYFKVRNSTPELEKIQEIWKSNKNMEMRDGYFKIQTVDISVGGFRSIAGIPIPKDTEFECIIYVNGEEINADAEIVNCMEYQGEDKNFDIRAKFVNIDKIDKAGMEYNFALNKTKPVDYDIRAKFVKIEKSEIEKLIRKFL